MSDELVSDGLGEMIEADWLEQREGVFEAVDRSVREAIERALRANREARARAIEEAEREVVALAEQRDALVAEVGELRAEASVLQPQLVAARQELQELERRRSVVEDIHRTLVRDAESRRSQMLGEVESLARQVTEMRSNLLGLLAAVDAAAALPELDSSRIRTASGPATGDAADRPAPSATGQENGAGTAASRPVELPPLETLDVPTPDLAKPARVVESKPAPPRGLPLASGSATMADAPAETTSEAAAVGEPSARASGDDSLPEFELPEPDDAVDGGKEAAPEAAPAEPQVVNLKITSLTNLAEGMQIRKAMRNLPGILSLSFPQFRDGTMTMTIRHERGPELVGDVTGLRDAHLTFVRAAGDTIEFSAAR